VAFLLPHAGEEFVRRGFQDNAAFMMVHEIGSPMAHETGTLADTLARFVPLEELRALPPKALAQLPQALARLESAALAQTLPCPSPARVRVRL